jgi:hypothetical protein
VHDLTAAWIWVIIAELAASGLVSLGDEGYIGEDPILRPVPVPEQARLAERRQPGTARLVSADSRQE